MDAAAPPTLYDRLRRAVDAVDALLMALGCLMLFALMLIVVADVSRRYLFNAPLSWSYEVISSYLMPGLFFLAASHTLHAHAHVSVDIVHNYVERRVRYLLEALTSVLATPVFWLCTGVSAQRTWEDFQSAATSTSGLPLPTWTISLLLPIGFGMLALRLTLNAIGFVASLAMRREVAALPPISGTEELTT